MPAIYWSLNDVIDPNPGGIGIGINGDDAFLNATRAALNAIQATANGAVLLQAILNRLPAKKRVAIFPPVSVRMSVRP